MKPAKKMDESQTMRHRMAMEQLEEEWESDQAIHQQAQLNSKGIRSSQISALVAYLIKKGVL
jgi:hypothetical protein